MQSTGSPLLKMWESQTFTYIFYLSEFLKCGWKRNKEMLLGRIILQVITFFWFLFFLLLLVILFVRGNGKKILKNYKSGTVSSKRNYKRSYPMRSWTHPLLFLMLNRSPPISNVESGSSSLHSHSCLGKGIPSLIGNIHNLHLLGWNRISIIIHRYLI